MIMGMGADAGDSDTLMRLLPQKNGASEWSRTTDLGLMSPTL
jgi:hypothetical protein